MIRWRVANIIKSFSRDRDDMLLVNFEPGRCFDTEWKLLCRPARDSLANLTPLWANGNFGANRSNTIAIGIH